ncbi:MAG: DEAD/DEAH box helicase, partial [Bdellovibrionales bacterium]|nr:DEAD/DEAH box helicase [Bdellovibrionales bacterium]
GNVADKMFHLSTAEKPQFLLSVLKKFAPKQVIIFSNFKNKVPKVAEFLTANGYPAAGISSLLSQAQRNRIIERFKTENNQHNILVATDVAARGLDIKGVDLVINYELPEDAENYVHRIGRTGRADQKGIAISFVSDKDVESMMRIEEYLKEKVEVIWLEEEDLIKDFKPMSADDYFKRDSALKRRPETRPPRARSSGPRRDRPEGGRSENGRSEGRNDNRPEQRRDEGVAGGNVHRDKRIGRHRDRTNGKDQPQAEGQQRDSQQRDSRRNNPQHRNSPSNGTGNRHGNSNNKRPYNNKNQRHAGAGTKSTGSKTTHRTSRPPQNTASVWGKITGSIKRLFGS